MEDVAKLATHYTGSALGELTVRRHRSLFIT
jgi:hypothetical protein